MYVSDDDDFYYGTQPRSLAALAERDRRREQLYLAQLAQAEQQHAPANVNKRTATSTSKDQNIVLVGEHGAASIQPNAIDGSTAMIVSASRGVSSTPATSNVGRGGVSECRSSAAAHIQYEHFDPTQIAHNTSNNNNNNEHGQVDENCGERPVIDADCRKSGDRQGDSRKLPRKMERSGYGSVDTVNVPVTPPSATGKNVLPPKGNFERKAKPGFLTRFTNFRFSLRGSSKKKLKSLEQNGGALKNASSNIVLVSTAAHPPPSTDANNAQNQVPMRSKANAANNRGGYQRNSMRSNEFEYIPLNDPPPSVPTSDLYVTSTPYQTPDRAAVPPPPTTPANGSAKPAKNVLTGKPPLPKHPPRVIGVCAKQPNGSGTPARPMASGKHADNGGGHAQQQQQQQRSSSAPRELHFNGSDAARATIQSPYRANGRDYTDAAYQFHSTRVAGESFARGASLKGAVSSDGLLMDGREHSFCAVSRDQDDDDDDDDGPIGLIETNLDTDETIISGKTRSLMELGPQLGANRASTIAVSRRHGPHGVNGTHPGNGIEPRRPHTSMEFLLDKENQRFVLVSTGRTKIPKQFIHICLVRVWGYARLIPRCFREVL